MTGPPGRPARREQRRTCVGCRAVRHPDDLVRVVAGPSGSLLVGRSLPGRGAWICRDGERCLQTAARRKAFDRALRATVAPGAVEALAAVLRSLGPVTAPAGREKEHIGEAFDDGSPDVRR